MSGDASGNVSDWRKWVITFGGLGLSPVAPGTVGSAGTALLLALAYYLGGDIAVKAALVVGLVAASIACVRLGAWAQAYFGRKDPQPCVLDEVAGVCLTMLALPLWTNGRGYWTLLAAFLAFRVFDVLKPPPARQLEKLPHGWGVLLDDLAAAVYANIACQIVLRLIGG